MTRAQAYTLARTSVRTRMHAIFDMTCDPHVHAVNYAFGRCMINRVPVLSCAHGHSENLDANKHTTVFKRTRYGTSFTLIQQGIRKQNCTNIW